MEYPVKYWKEYVEYPVQYLSQKLIHLDLSVMRPLVAIFYPQQISSHLDSFEPQFQLGGSLKCLAFMWLYPKTSPFLFFIGISGTLPGIPCLDMPLVTPFNSSSSSSPRIDDGIKKVWSILANLFNWGVFAYPHFLFQLEFVLPTQLNTDCIAENVLLKLISFLPVTNFLKAKNDLSRKKA